MQTYSYILGGTPDTSSHILKKALYGGASGGPPHIIIKVWEPPCQSLTMRIA